ncbi:MAG: hypothetical protein ACTHU0_39505 [Kofleriaceae bacterium]
MKTTWAKLRALGRAALYNLFGVFFIAGAIAIAVLDAKADGDLKLSTWVGCSVLLGFGAWLIDPQLLDRFIKFAVSRGRDIGAAIRGTPPTPPAGGSNAPQ